MSETTKSVLIQHLTPRNFLSFGPENEGIDLRALNLFIGPNGSGKSNLIEAVNLMRAAPKELREVTRKGGGVKEWIWKGGAKNPASVDWVVNRHESITLLRLRPVPLRHVISFREVGQAFALEDERVEGSESPETYSIYRYQHGQSILKSAHQVERRLAGYEPSGSILAHLRDPVAYPELTWLSHTYEKVRIYREWAFGRNTVFRDPQQADMRRHVLEEDFSNLGLFLNRIRTEFPAAKRAILHALQDLYDGITDFEVSTNGGTVQVFLHEGDFPIPATRLSDGTLRYLCLLAILCDPEPPPLICLEEPELGLHPDILPKVADLLRAASERTQLIVTTHSDILVDAMTETPEAIVVCTKEEGQTRMERLKREDLSRWLEKYRLGQLWIEGQIGGKRW